MKGPDDAVVPLTAIVAVSCESAAEYDKVMDTDALVTADAVPYEKALDPDAAPGATVEDCA